MAVIPCVPKALRAMCTLQKALQRNNLPSSCDLSFLSYADDIQQHLAIDQFDAQVAAAKHDHCIANDCDCNVCNFPNLTGDIAELFFVGHPKRLAEINDFELSVGCNKVKTSPFSRNLTVRFDSLLSFNPLAQTSAAAAIFHMRSQVAIRDHP